MASIVQSSAATAANVGVTLTGVTAGNALVVQLINATADTRVWSISDNVDGSWANVHNAAHVDEGCSLVSGYILDHTGGDVTVSISVDAGSVLGTIIAHEVSGVGELDMDFQDWDSENVNVSTSQLPAPVAVSANSITFLSQAHNAGAGNHTFVEAGWTEILDNDDEFWAYRADASSTSVDGENTHGSRDSAILMFGLRQAAADETAPTLSSASGTATGATTGSGSVSTDEGNGTLYWVVTQSATSPSVAQVQAGQDHAGSAADDSGSQSVSGTGSQNVSGGFTGLTAETTYYAHYQHQDAATNDSTVASSSSFTTSAADVTAPTIQSATVNAAGTTLTLGFDEAVTRGAGHTDSDFTLQMSGGAATLTYSSGDGTSSLAFTISRSIGSGETGNLDYVQPTDGIEDSSGNDLASFTDQAVTNNAGSSSALLLLDS